MCTNSIECKSRRCVHIDTIHDQSHVEAMSNYHKALESRVIARSNGVAEAQAHLSYLEATHESLPLGISCDDFNVSATSVRYAKGDLVEANNALSAARYAVVVSSRSARSSASSASLPASAPSSSLSTPLFSTAKLYLGDAKPDDILDLLATVTHGVTNRQGLVTKGELVQSIKRLLAEVENPGKQVATKGVCKVDNRPALLMRDIDRHMRNVKVC